MMRLKHGMKFYAVLGMMCAGICLGKGQVANAGDTANVEISPDKVYQYDVTKDGVEDTVKVKIENHKNESGTIKIFVNDKVAFEQKRQDSPNWEVKLIKLENDNVYFDIMSKIMSDDDCIHKLYRCENGKLKSVYDFQKYFDQYADYYFADVVDVSGNTITTAVRAQFYLTGSIQFDVKLKDNDGTLTRTSDAFTPKYKEMSRKNKWTAERKIKAYKSAGSKQTAYTLKKGTVVKLNKIIYKNNKVYIQIKNKNGKTGYLTAPKTSNGTAYFKEAQYAG